MSKNGSFVPLRIGISHSTKAEWTAIQRRQHDHCSSKGGAKQGGNSHEQPRGRVAMPTTTTRLRRTKPKSPWAKGGLIEVQSGTSSVQPYVQPYVQPCAQQCAQYPAQPFVRPRIRGCVPKYLRDSQVHTQWTNPWRPDSMSCHILNIMK